TGLVQHADVYNVRSPCNSVEGPEVRRAGRLQAITCDDACDMRAVAALIVVGIPIRDEVYSAVSTSVVCDRVSQIAAGMDAAVQHGNANALSGHSVLLV